MEIIEIMETMETMEVRRAKLDSALHWHLSRVLREMVWEYHKPIHESLICHLHELRNAFHFSRICLEQGTLRVYATITETAETETETETEMERESTEETKEKRFWFPSTHQEFVLISFRDTLYRIGLGRIDRQPDLDFLKMLPNPPWSSRSQFKPWQTVSMFPSPFRSPSFQFRVASAQGNLFFFWEDDRDEAEVWAFLVRNPGRKEEGGGGGNCGDWKKLGKPTQKLGLDNLVLVERCGGKVPRLYIFGRDPDDEKNVCEILNLRTLCFSPASSSGLPPLPPGDYPLGALWQNWFAFLGLDRSMQLLNLDVRGKENKWRSCTVPFSLFQSGLSAKHFSWTSLASGIYFLGQVQAGSCSCYRFCPPQMEWTEVVQLPEEANVLSCAAVSLF